MKRLLFIIPFALFACIPDNPGIEISNNTMVKYDSIKVFSTPNIPTIFKNVRPKDDLNARILFDKNNLSDGAYTIQIYKDGKIVRYKSFGYYTNGKSLNRKIKVVIEPDTLKVSFK
ncbi:MAG: hypothetical protein AB2L24_00890 [Mangrovibacterium sp.]